MIKRYSSSYTNSKENFAIIYKEKTSNPDRFKNSKLYGVLCVVQNIIQRGQPTNPSEYLVDKIGYLGCDEREDASRYFWISDTPANWEQTIKGAVETSDYPALTFFNEIIPEYLGEYAFVRNLIIPEADFEDVIGEKTGFSGQQVDFYIPKVKIAIEIDGSSHSGSDQAAKDSARDRELNRHQIKTLRIKSYDIKNKTARLQGQMDWLKQQLVGHKVIEGYRSALGRDYDEKEIAIETVMRLQMLLLLCLRNRTIDLNQPKWRVRFSYSEVDYIDELLMIAYEDLKRWLTAITTLLKLKINYPEIEIVDAERRSDIVINYGIQQRYDDTCKPSDNEFIIRTDYYRGRDYYQVAVSDTLIYKLELEEPSEDHKQLLFLLANIFSIEPKNGFKAGQLSIMANVLEGRDTVGILPTGGGKSLCYQLTALLQPGVTIIVDPIISLMQDQKRSMRDKHIDHNEMVSSMPKGANKGSVLKAFQKGRYQMLWVSPERFQNEEFRKSLSEINRNLTFCMAVVDEVHCLSEWGHDFRPSFLALVRTIREYCPAAILLGLTATASEFVLTDIRVEFGGEDGILEYSNVKTKSSLERNDLLFCRTQVKDQREREEKIKDILHEEFSTKKNESGLLFCPKVKGRGKGRGTDCLSMSAVVSEVLEDKFGLFHGQMEQEEKEQAQKDYMNDAFPLMICTKAFGMGIDKGNIGFTIHDSLPLSVEAFYQEAGRAGRGDKYDEKHPARCYIIFRVNDKEREELEKLSNNSLEVLEDEKRKQFSNCDLNTPLYFLSSNHMHEDQETDYIKRLLLYLYGGNPVVFQQWDRWADNYKQKVENALYKLALLGLVSNWTVHYQSLSKGTITVDMIGNDRISEDNVLNSFLSYVKKYDDEFSLEGKRGNQYLSLYNRRTDKITNIIQMLVRWTNNNIVYQRIVCLNNIAQWCSLDDVSNSRFRELLEGYFRVSEKTILLDEIAHNPKDIDKWFDCFYELNEEKTHRAGIISQKEAREIHAGLQRFLESYQNNTGLNYLDGLLRLFTSPAVSRDDLRRMERSLEVIMEMPVEDRNRIFMETLSVGQYIDSLNGKDLLSQVLLDYYLQKTRSVFNALHDRYSLSLELEEMTERLESIKWII